MKWLNLESDSLTDLNGDAIEPQVVTGELPETQEAEMIDTDEVINVRLVDGEALVEESDLQGRNQKGEGIDAEVLFDNPTPGEIPTIADNVTLISERTIALQAWSNLYNNITKDNDNKFICQTSAMIAINLESTFNDGLPVNAYSVEPTKTHYDTAVSSIIENVKLTLIDLNEYVQSSITELQSPTPQEVCGELLETTKDNLNSINVIINNLNDKYELDTELGETISVLLVSVVSLLNIINK